MTLLVWGFPIGSRSGCYLHRNNKQMWEGKKADNSLKAVTVFVAEL